VDTADHARGAYGLEVIGLPDVGSLVEIESGLWPQVQVRVDPAPPIAPATAIGSEHAVLSLDGGESAILERRERTAVFTTSDGSDQGRLVHPLLTAAGTVFAWWHGREAFHGGAFVTKAGAWAVLGGRGSGKSSLLAAIAAAGHDVLADDLLVVDGDAALAGPRCVDLRPDATGPSGIEGRTTAVRGNERERLPLGSVAPAVALCGWILLAWGRGLRTRSLGPSERLERVSAQRNVQGVRQAQFLHLMRLPAWELERPREWASIEVTVEMALGLADSGVGKPSGLKK
jgi:hypothetical protein